MFNKENNKTNYKYYKSIKKTIKIDIDKLKNSLIYKDNIIGTIPEELILKGKKLFDGFDIYLKKFPIEKLILDIEKVYITGFLYFFDKTKTLELTNNSKNVTIFNSLQLKNLDKLIIPYDIDSFKIIRRDNKINTINIKYNDEILNIKLPKNTLNKKGNIEIKKDNDNNLIILVDFNTKIEYKVFIKDKKLEFERKYFKYEITKDRKCLDLIVLKKIFNAEFIFNEPLEIMKLTIEKKIYL